MGHGALVAVALIAVVARHLGEHHPMVDLSRKLLMCRAAAGAFDNVLRVDSFGFMATGDLAQFGRVAFYVRGATEEQRQLSRGEDLPWICIDLESADDVAYILAARDELHCTYGVEPVTIFGEERIRAANNPIASSGD